ncbi:MAG: HipA family kinase [Gemmatimonadota bacterium]
MPTHTAMRYVQPLREGGSLPAVVDTRDGLYVAKFRGSGQGAKALVAELVVGLIADEIGLPVPALALIDVPPPFGLSEPDPEIQDLLRASEGLNVGLRYLDGAFNFALRAAAEAVTPELAARLVWLDAFVTNPDRSPRNPNLLVHDRKLWLIDHGAALYAHHDWASVDEKRTRAPFPLIEDHVLLTVSGDLLAADAECAATLAGDVLEHVLAAVPDALLMDPVAARDFASADDARERYVRYLRERLREPRAFVAAAVAARARRLAEPPRQMKARR